MPCPEQFMERQNKSCSYHQNRLYNHDSVVTFAFAFVTFTPNCFAFAMISTRFRDETLWAILRLLLASNFAFDSKYHILCGKCLVVHKKKVNVASVVDKEGFVSGRHQESRLFVRTIANLCNYNCQYFAFK